MTITIYKGNDNHSVMLGSNDSRFVDAWGSVVKIPAAAVYTDLAQITLWANEILGEEVLFKVHTDRR